MHCCCELTLALARLSCYCNHVRLSECINKHTRTNWLVTSELCLLLVDVDDVVSSLIKDCHRKNVPCIFALGRKALGKACLKSVPVSTVGIVSCSGDEVRVLSTPLGGIHPLTFEDTPGYTLPAPPVAGTHHVIFGITCTLQNAYSMYFVFLEWLLRSLVAPNFKFSGAMPRTRGSTPDPAVGAYDAPRLHSW